jgi:hypothetical protein
LQTGINHAPYVRKFAYLVRGVTISIAANLSSELGAVMQSLAPDDEISVIVTLADQEVFYFQIA